MQRYLDGTRMLFQKTGKEVGRLSQRFTIFSVFGGGARKQPSTPHERSIGSLEKIYGSGFWAYVRKTRSSVLKKIENQPSTSSHFRILSEAL